MLIATIAISCFFLSHLIGYQVVALILLMAVSLLAMLFDILPVLVIATVSALVWNFFFIPPIFTFHVGTGGDTLMLIMYFVVALINAVLMSRIRRVEKIARDKKEKENTIKLYSTIFNSLSHELKTPISTVIAAADTLALNLYKLSDETKEELISEIEKAGIRLKDQVENLLNMSRIESGLIKIQPDWCDLSELINHVVANLGNKKSQVIIFDIEKNLPLFKLDNVLIEIVIENIFRNAITYTPEGSEIKIKVSKKRDNCIIEISDNGPGFPKNEIKYVFEKFYRLRNTATGGTGLGLSIAKGFTEAHGGKIALENIPSGGAKFTISIPAESTSLIISGE